LTLFYTFLYTFDVRTREQAITRIAVLGTGALVLAARLVAAHPAIDPAAAHSGDRLALVTAWSLALGLSLWLVIGCALALAAVARPATAPSIVTRLPRVVRRLVEVALVGSCIVGSAVPASAISARPPSAVLVVRDDPVLRAPVAPVAPMAPAAPIAPSTTHVVQPGDNLWRIARNALGSVSRADVLSYWHALVAENRPHLRSGNPNLIYPGEIVTMPAKPPTQ
jgi:hypothetical protein